MFVVAVGTMCFPCQYYCCCFCRFIFHSLFVLWVIHVCVNVSTYILFFHSINALNVFAAYNRFAWKCGIHTEARHFGLGIHIFKVFSETVTKRCEPKSSTIRMMLNWMDCCQYVEIGIFLRICCAWHVPLSLSTHSYLSLPPSSSLLIHFKWIKIWKLLFLSVVYHPVRPSRKLPSSEQK